jgi:hypothetical protein
MVRHVLDGGAEGETGWLLRLNGFQQKETRRQVHFKWHHWPGLGDGTDPDQPGETYPHILPAGFEREVFCPEHVDALLAYVEREGIYLSERVLNLRSSQVACLNVLFPVRQNPQWGALVLEPLLPGIARLQQVHIEYTGPESATQWLGEPAEGGRGRYRTSVDAAFEWLDHDGARRLTLVEWKYTEAAFGDCGGFKSEANRQTERCKNMRVPAVDPGVDCYLATKNGPTTMRRYWEHLVDAGIDLSALAGALGCPFRGSLNQLLRQTLLAGYLRGQGVADQVDVAVVSFQHNRSLLKVPRELKALPGDDILSVWNSALVGAPALRSVTVEQVMQSVDRAGAADPAWRGYLKERYGI